jgi:flagellin
MALGFGGTSAARSIHYMNRTKAAMDKSLLKISSGSRIVSPADDPGGLAIAMKLKSTIANNNASLSNVENAKSFTQTQSSTLEEAANIIIEMQTIKQTFDDEGGRAGANATTLEEEYDNLYNQLRYGLGSQKLGGVDLFNRGDVTVQTSTDSSSGIEIDDIAYEQLILPDSGSGQLGVSGIDAADNDLDAALTRVTSEITRVGGDYSALEFASNHLSGLSNNLEAALGRIEDVDVAEETTNYASLKMQYEAAAAAIVQANSSTETVFNLLMSSLTKD